MRMAELFKDVREKQTKKETATVNFATTGMKTFIKTSCKSKFPLLSYGT